MGIFLFKIISPGTVGNPTEIEDDGIFGQIPVSDNHRTGPSPVNRRQTNVPIFKEKFFCLMKI